MPKLHELLAVEGDLKSRAQQAKNTIIRLFTEGTGRLLGRIITYQVDEGEDPRQPEITELATTVTIDGIDIFKEALPATALFYFRPIRALGMGSWPRALCVQGPRDQHHQKSNKSFGDV